MNLISEHFGTYWTGTGENPTTCLATCPQLVFNLIEPKATRRRNAEVHIGSSEFRSARCAERSGAPQKASDEILRSMQTLSSRDFRLVIRNIQQRIFE
jgi:hypothetical protein